MTLDEKLEPASDAGMELTRTQTLALSVVATAWVMNKIAWFLC